MAHALSLSKIVFWLFAEALFYEFKKINRKLEEIMALVSIEQDELNSVAQTVSDVADSLQSVLDSETPLEAADESALQAAVEKLKGVGPKVTAPPADGA